MDDIERPSPEPAPDVGRWIGRLLIAVILGEGVWGLIVSLTNNLILPSLARIMGTDARSPLSLGNGQFNVPGLFISVLELCFAGIVAVILNSLIQLQRKAKPTRSKPVRVTPIPVQPAAPRPSPLSILPVSAPEPAPQPAPIAVPETVTATPATPPRTASQSPGQFWSPPEPAPAKAVSPPKPAKPKPPREIVYNSVGEPLPFDDDE
jgi:hypothetical protein